MSGFDNEVVYANNVDFSGSTTVTAQLVTNGQMLIGSTALNAGGTHINVGEIVSTNSGIRVNYVTPDIQLTLAEQSYAFWGANIGGNPADSTTYVWTSGISINATSLIAASKLFIPKNGTVRAVLGSFRVAGTLGSNENCTFAIRLNDTTNTNITTTLQLTAVENAYSNFALAIPVVAGDFLSFQFITPAWATNPTTVSYSFTIFIS